MGVGLAVLTETVASSTGLGKVLSYIRQIANADPCKLQPSAHTNIKGELLVQATPSL